MQKLLSRSVARNVALLPWARLDVWVLSFTIASIVPYWESKGVMLAGGMLLQIAFSGAIGTLEVPSGYLADAIGRRKTLIMGGLLRIVAIAIYGFGHGFWQLLVAEVLLGVSLAFDSGTDEALLRDSLLELGEVHRFRKIWGDALAIQFGFGAFGCFTGSILAGIDLTLPYKVSLGCAILLQMPRMLLTEPHRSKTASVVPREVVLAIVKLAKFCVLDNPVTRWVLVGSAITHALLQTGFWLYQPYFTSVEIPLAANGSILAVFQIVSAAAAKRAPQILEKHGRDRVVWLMLGGLGFGFLFAFLTPTAVGVLFIFGHQFTRGFTKVLFAEEMNRQVDSSHRATALSIRNLTSNVGYSIAMFFIASIQASRGWEEAWITLTVLSFVLIPLLSKRAFGP